MSIFVMAAIAGIIIAGTIAVAMPTAAFAEKACDGGNAGFGKAGGAGVSGGTYIGGGNGIANDRSGNGPAGADANGCSNSS